MAAVLVTGGTQRLGLAMVESLLEKNIPVIVTYRTHKPTVDALQKQGADVVCCDFAKPNAVAELITYITSKYSVLRGIIHNASDWDQEKGCENFAALFDKMMHVHASVPYQLNLALQPLLEAYAGVADVIHMTDYVQVKGSQKHIAYAASKAALHNLTLSFATLLAPQVKVNSIAPALLIFNDHDSDEYKAKALKKSLLEICPGAQEAVKAMHFLFASDYITGQTMHLDGGRHLK